METAAHIPVLTGAVLDSLVIRPEGFYADGTFGRGGHSRAVLERLGPSGRLLAMDQDPDAQRAAQPMLADCRFRFVSGRFSGMADVVRQGWPGVGLDGALLDLGVSSPQLDEPGRGFSFQHDGPLDMRMNPETGPSAADFVNSADADEIADVIHRLGEERYARRIARSIVEARRAGAIGSTARLAALVRRAVPRVEAGRHPATRTFQALRMHVNRELEELQSWLNTIPSVLRPGARLAVISFHSLEDRLVKHAFQGRVQGPRLPRGLPVVEAARIPLLRMIGRPIRPDDAECSTNPRARSAVLRVAERRS